MFGNDGLGLVRENDSVCTFLQCPFKLLYALRLMPLDYGGENVGENLQHTRGINSAGSVTSRCASSSLYLIKSVILTSQ